MTTTTIPPAAAQGDHRTQLAHLKAHRTFQRQQGFDVARLSWNTTITRAQSRLHTTRHLHHKINTKQPGFHQEGTLNSIEGQDHLKQFARRLRNGERLSPADGYQLNWHLRQKAIKAHYRHQDDFQPACPGVLAPKDQAFPRIIRELHDYLNHLKALLREQAISPKRHREYLIVDGYHCHHCKTVSPPHR